MANPPTFSNVKLLCHFNGTNGDTATVDSSSFARTLTRVGVALSSAQAKFGATSLASGGFGTFSAGDSADFAFGAGQFTVEAWIRLTSAPGAATQSVVNQWPSNGQLSFFLGWSSSSFGFFYSTDGSNNPSVGAAWTPTLNTWYHVAADRDASNVLRVYIDGVVHASATVASTIFDSNGNVETAGFIAWPGITGYIDELRIVKGEAVYGGAFTPPTAEFPAGTNARVSQAVAEVLRTNTAVKAQVSQSVVEVLRTNTAVKAQVSQAVVEVLRTELTVTAPPNPGHGGGNQGHPPKQDRKGLYSPTITMGTWIDQFRPNLSGLDKFFGAPGQPVPNYDWPVPKGRVPGIELRTWLQKPRVNQDSMYGPPGMVPAYDWPNPRQARFQFRGPRFSTDMTEQYSRPSGLIPPAAPVATAHGLRTNSTSYTWTGEKGEIELSYVFGNGREFDDSGIYSGIYNPEDE